MVQHKPTPEEQLLKLIEGGGSGARGEGPEASVKTQGEKSKRSLSLGKIPGFLDYAKKVFSKNGSKWNGGFRFDIKNLNNLLLALVIASAIFLVVDLIFFRPDKANFLSQISTTEAVYPVRREAPERITSDISAYKTAAQKRNPFLPPQAVVLSGPADSGKNSAPTAPGTTGTLAEALQGIKLVGISWSENPLAMVEDVATGRTYFLRKGQEMKGIKVQDISKEKVTVTYQGQEGDLF